MKLTDSNRRLEIAAILVVYAPEIESVRPPNIFGGIGTSANNCCGMTCFNFSTKRQLIAAQHVPAVT